MKIESRLLIVSVFVAVALSSGGCAVVRDQQSVGAYVDDTAITSAVKAKFVSDNLVDAGAISVETLNGTVMLSGFAKSEEERKQAESIARAVKGVKAVENKLDVRK